MASIVLFDGVCNFCNGAVNFIIRHDHGQKFKFAPLQSHVGQELRTRHGVGDDVDSIILVEGDRVYLHSTAALRIANGLGGIFSLAYALIIVPPFIRDFLYKAFAKFRYRLFGRKDVCMMPTPDVRARFL
jgi:predicted DCC family thiol-disulfide oxidoreductase YuxK